MPAFRDRGRWRYRKLVTLPDGSKTRISGTCTPNTKAECERAERLAIERVLIEGPRIGRKPAAGEARTNPITVRVNDAELREWSGLADAIGCSSVSEMIRAAVDSLMKAGAR